MQNKKIINENCWCGIHISLPHHISVKHFKLTEKTGVVKSYPCHTTFQTGVAAPTPATPLPAPLSTTTLTSSKSTSPPPLLFPPQTQAPLGRDTSVDLCGEARTNTATPPLRRRFHGPAHIYNIVLLILAWLNLARILSVFRSGTIHKVCHVFNAILTPPMYRGVARGGGHGRMSPSRQKKKS